MSGLAYKKDALAIKADKMVRVLRGGNIGEEQFYFKGDDVFISSELVKPELYLRENYMITPAVSSLDHIGKIALIDKDYSDTVVGGFVLMLIPHFNDDVVSEYLLYAFAAKHHRDNCRNITHKSGQIVHQVNDSDATALEAWMMDNSGGQCLCGTQNDQILSDILIDLYNTVHEVLRHPQLSNSFRCAIDAFMNDDISDDSGTDDYPF